MTKNWKRTTKKPERRKH